MTSQRGSVSVVVVTLTTAMLLVAGLVWDGGRVLGSHRDADAVAAAAARAGAQGVSETGLRTQTSAPLDPVDAQRRVQLNLTDTGFAGTATVAGDTVTVSVHRTEQLPLLSLAGLHSTEITGTGTARAVRGGP